METFLNNFFSQVEALQPYLSFLPHRAAVEIDHHPLVGVHVEGLGVLHPLHQRPELRADEGAPGITGVHMKPGSQLLLNIEHQVKV